jgi:hypothetical protein
MEHEPVVVVVGEKQSIKVVSSDDLSGPRLCTFTPVLVADDKCASSAGLASKEPWQETLDFSCSFTPKDPDEPLDESTEQKTTGWVAEWVVKVSEPKTQPGQMKPELAIPEITHFVRVEIHKGAYRIKAANEFRIPGIAVTADPEMREIMLHEFNEETHPGLKDWRFKRKPLEDFIKTLTVEQRKNLCRVRGIDDSNCRDMVVFITLRGTRTTHPMYSDNTPALGKVRWQVYANADFSLFRRGPVGHRITLECHTEYFCVNNNNLDKKYGVETKAFLQAAHNYNKMDPNHPNPWRLLLTAEQHEYCIYFWVLNDFKNYDCRVDGKVTATVRPGETIMVGNNIHGGINTKGCWMLFRNYNWPIVCRDRFLNIYLNDLREKGRDGNDSQLLAKLEKLGYDEKNDNFVRSSSYFKFVGYDRNHAYTYFCRYVLGVKFYSSGGFTNLYQTHGHTKDETKLSDFPPLPTVPPKFETEEKSFNKDNRYVKHIESTHAAHRWPEAFVNQHISDDSQWDSTNHFGDATPGSWDTETGRQDPQNPKTAVQLKAIKDKAWAECYVFNPNPDELTPAKFKEIPFGDLPDPIPDVAL